METQPNHSLSQYTTEELERLLKADVEPSELDAETIEEALRLLNERDPIDLPDVEQVWEEFQTYYNTPDGKKERLYSCELPQMRRKKRRPLRYVGLVAASIGVLFALLSVAQAAGLKVFDALGRWTDDFFSFARAEKTLSEYDDEDFTPQNTLQQALADFGMPPQLAPSELPEGYQLSELVYNDTLAFRTVASNYTNEAGEVIRLDFTGYSDPKVLEGAFYPKDAGDPEIFVHNDMEFYVFSNAGSWSAVWGDAKYSVFISAPSRETVISILKSIP